MKATATFRTSQWLQTSDPVVAVGASISSDAISAVRAALKDGVVATSDQNRTGFYDVEIGNCWYYIHIAKHLSRVFVIGQLGQFGNKEETAWISNQCQSNSRIST